MAFERSFQPMLGPTVPLQKIEEKAEVEGGVSVVARFKIDDGEAL